MNILAALFKVDPFLAKKHVLVTIDETKGHAFNAAQMMQMPLPTLNKWIEKLNLFEDIDNLIRIRKYQFASNQFKNKNP